MIKQRQKNKLLDASYRKLNKEKHSSGSDEETELFTRSKPVRKEIPTMEKDVEDGDTLQSLAIQYHCTISELKRLNNIHNENEIFAKRTVRVPLRAFTMALAGVHISGSTSPTFNEPSTSNLIDVDSLNFKLYESVLNVPKGTKDDKVNDIIFNSHITQKSCDSLNEDTDDDDGCEEVHLLPQHSRSTPEADVVSRLNCSGVDGGISWIALIACIVIVIFAAPLIYAFYTVEHLKNMTQHQGS